jgi:hypothetical protein
VAKQKPTPDKSLVIDHGTLVDWVNEADDATLESRTWSEKSRDYYDSKQISATEAKVLKQRKQAPVVINRIKPKIDGLAGMERQNRTTARAYPRTPLHEKDATGATEAIRFVLDDNFFSQLRSQAWDNLTIEGTGGLEVVVKPYGKDFKICLHHVMWDRIIYDPHSRRKDFSDARYLGQVMWMDYDQALAEFPEGKDILETMQQGSDTYDDKPRWMDSKRKRVKIVELYYLDGRDWYYACFTMGGYLKPKKISPYVNEEGETEHPYEFASLFVDREGSRYGAVLQYLDVQDEINKRRSKALHLMSVRQIMLERGAVEDVNKTRQELAKPDGVIEITPGMEFELLKTNDMAAAQFNLLQEAKNEIDAVGYNAAASGKESKSMSGVALESRRMAGQTEIATMFDVLRHMDIRIYRKVWKRIKQYWKAEKWLRVTDDRYNLKWVPINYKAPGQEKMVNNIAELDVDIIIDDAPDSVTMQQEEFVALSEMVKSGIPVPPSAIIEASNLKNKDRILAEMKQGQVNPEQVKKLQEEMQAIQQENQALKADQQTEMAKIATKSKADQEALAAKHQQALAELEIKKQVQAAELQLMREKAAAEIQLEREKAQAQIALEREKASAQVELEQMKIAASSDGEVDKAITEVKTLATVHDAKLKGAVAADEAKDQAKKEGDSKAQAKAMQGEMKQFAEQIVKQLAQKKKVTMTLSDGRTAEAEIG